MLQLTGWGSHKCFIIRLRLGIRESDLVLKATIVICAKAASWCKRSTVLRLSGSTFQLNRLGVSDDSHCLSHAAAGHSHLHQSLPYLQQQALLPPGSPARAACSLYRLLPRLHCPHASRQPCLPRDRQCDYQQSGAWSNQPYWDSEHTNPLAELIATCHSYTWDSHRLGQCMREARL